MTYRDRRRDRREKMNVDRVSFRPRGRILFSLKIIKTVFDAY